MEVRQSESESGLRARIMRAREAGLDFPRLTTRGGVGALALVGLAFGGLYLPGPARLGIVALGAVVARFLPGQLRLAVALVVGWLALAWGLGLLSPIVAAALVALIVLEARLWWGYREARLADSDEEPARPRALTPDDRLDALLADAPLEGLAFAEIVNAMAPYMVRSTVAAKLKQRGWRVTPGRWRSRPTGVDES